MKIELPKSVVDSLPAPGEDGLIRVTAELKVGSDGSVMLQSVNDSPVPTGGEDDGEGEESTSDVPEQPELDTSYANEQLGQI